MWLCVANQPVRSSSNGSLLLLIWPVFENYVEILEVDDDRVELSLWDTAGPSNGKMVIPIDV